MTLVCFVKKIVCSSVTAGGMGVGGSPGYLYPLFSRFVVKYGYMYIERFLEVGEAGELLGLMPAVKGSERVYERYGRKVPYPGGYKGVEWPDGLGKYVKRVEGLLGVVVESMVVNGYGIGGGLGAHVDKPTCGERVIILSLGAAAVLRFTKEMKVEYQELKEGSLFVMEGEKRWEWKHEVLPVAGPRWSVVFRT